MPVGWLASLPKINRELNRELNSLEGDLEGEGFWVEEGGSDVGEERFEVFGDGLRIRLEVLLGELVVEPVDKEALPLFLADHFLDNVANDRYSKLVTATGDHRQIHDRKRPLLASSKRHKRKIVQLKFRQRSPDSAYAAPVRFAVGARSSKGVVPDPVSPNLAFQGPQLRHILPLRALAKGRSERRLIRRVRAE